MRKKLILLLMGVLSYSNIVDETNQSNNDTILNYETTIENAMQDLNSIQNIYLIATCHRLLANYDESIKYYQKLLNIESNPKTLFGIALAYRGKGDKSMAIEYLNQIYYGPEYILKNKEKLIQELSN